MKRKPGLSMPPKALAVAVCAALGALAATPTLADPLLGIKLFRDADVMFRDSDMSRWAENYVEFGAGWNSKDSYRFGQFSGLNDRGAFPILGFNWQKRDNSNDAQFWRVYGSKLGLDSRKLLAEGGVQGRWTAMASVDQLKRHETESAQFFHLGLGSTNLTLPAVFLKRPNAVALGTANPGLLNSFGIVQGRDIYRLGLAAQLPSNWDFKLNYREDHRDGTRLTGLPFNASGGPTAIIPYPIDDKTRQVEAVLAYTAKHAQFQLGYTYSRYENALTSLTVETPWGTNAGVVSGNNARMSLMPSNDYHQINATGAYNFTKHTRLTAQASYGIARQNEAFLPYAATGAGSNLALLPRASADGRVDKTLLDVALTTKPVDKMNLKVAYTYRNSDNKTPIAQYLYFSRDTTTAPSAASASTRSNSPMSTKEQKFVVDGDYQIMDRTTLRASLEHTDTNYTRADREKTRTDKLSLELRRPVSDEFLGSLGYAYTQKRGSEYDKHRYFRDTYTNPAFQTTQGFTNHPSMRPYLFADYDENRVRASGNWTVSETVSLQGGIDNYEQRFKGPECSNVPNATLATNAAISGSLPLPDTCLGRNKARGLSLNADLQWQPEENLTTFAFYNYSQFDTDQRGRSFVAGGSNTVDGTKNSGESTDWFGDMTYRDQAIGLGLKWQPQEKWDLGGNYIFSHGIGKAFVTQPASGASGGMAAITAASPLNDSSSKLHTLQFFAKWRYSKQVTWRFNYVYENLRSGDFAYDGLTPASISNVLLTGQRMPKYENHVIGVSASIHSW